MAGVVWICILGRYEKRVAVSAIARRRRRIASIAAWVSVVVRPAPFILPETSNAAPPPSLLLANDKSPPPSEGSAEIETEGYFW